MVFEKVALMSAASGNAVKRILDKRCTAKTPTSGEYALCVEDRIAIHRHQGFLEPNFKTLFENQRGMEEQS